MLLQGRITLKYVCNNILSMLWWFGDCMVFCFYFSPKLKRLSESCESLLRTKIEEAAKDYKQDPRLAGKCRSEVSLHAHIFFICALTSLSIATTNFIILNGVELIYKVVIWTQHLLHTGTGSVQSIQ